MFWRNNIYNKIHIMSQSYKIILVKMKNKLKQPIMNNYKMK